MFLIGIYLRERPEIHNLCKLMCADKMREAMNISARFFSLIIILTVSRNCLDIRYYTA